MAAESWSANELLAAGWGEADLAFEAAAERSVEALAANDFRLAVEQAGKAPALDRDVDQGLFEVVGGSAGVLVHARSLPLKATTRPARPNRTGKRAAYARRPCECCWPR